MIRIIRVRYSGKVFSSYWSLTAGTFSQAWRCKREYPGQESTPNSFGFLTHFTIPQWRLSQNGGSWVIENPESRDPDRGRYLGIDEHTHPTSSARLALVDRPFNWDIKVDDVDPKAYL